METFSFFLSFINAHIYFYTTNHSQSTGRRQSPLIVQIQSFATLVHLICIRNANLQLNRAILFEIAQNFSFAQISFHR